MWACGPGTGDRTTNPLVRDQTALPTEPIPQEPLYTVNRGHWLKEEAHPVHAGMLAEANMLTLS